MSNDFSGASPMIAAQREMRSREKLVWAGRPVRWTAIRKALSGVLTGLVIIAIAAVWSGFAYILTANDDAGSVFRIFPYIGFFFALFGLAIALSGLLSFRRTNSTLYALSDQRLVTVSERPKKIVRAIDLAGITRVVTKEGWGGSGALTVFTGRTGRETLLGVPGVARVAADLDRLRAKAAEARRNDDG
ncbi:MAG: hypothetical protein RLO48_07750 [Bauldia litoralis]